MCVNSKYFLLALLLTPNLANAQGVGFPQKDLSKDPVYQMLAGQNNQIDVFAEDGNSINGEDPFAKFRGNQNPTQSGNEQIKLLCSNNVESKMFIVDYTKQSVNGLPAVFGDVDIRFEQKGVYGKENVRIDRYNSTISISSNNLSNYTGICQIAPQRKF